LMSGTYIRYNQVNSGTAIIQKESETEQEREKETQLWPGKQQDALRNWRNWSGTILLPRQRRRARVTPRPPFPRSSLPRASCSEGFFFTTLTGRHCPTTTVLSCQRDTPRPSSTRSGLLQA